MILQVNLLLTDDAQIYMKSKLFARKSRRLSQNVLHAIVVVGVLLQNQHNSSLADTFLHALCVLEQDTFIIA